MTTIRIVDDDVELTEDLAADLTKAGYTVTTRDRVQGLVEDLVENRPDLLILDVMFPDNPAGGFDGARAVREDPRTSDIPVIMLTGVNQEFPMDFSAQDIDPDWTPVQDFIEKPPELPALLAKIEQLLQAKG